MKHNAITTSRTVHINIAYTVLFYVISTLTLLIGACDLFIITNVSSTTNGGGDVSYSHSPKDQTELLDAIKELQDRTKETLDNGKPNPNYDSSSTDTEDPTASLNSIDTSTVTNMKELFKDKDTFNGDISRWNVSQVTTMESMFNGADAFNQDISGWNVSSVQNMNNMFFGVDIFNKPLNNWNVSSVTTMISMFNGAKVFNQPLDKWNVSNVTNMGTMFRSAVVFNQPLNSWEVSEKIINMGNMFSNAEAFCQDLSSWGGKLQNDKDNISLFFMFQGAGTKNCTPSSATPPFKMPPQWYLDL